MLSKLKFFLVITFISILPTLFIWIPFFFRFDSVWGIPLPQNGMATVVSNYDGPLYLVVAKTLYNPDLIGNFEFDLPSSYYSAHFPLYPLLIRIFSNVFGYPYAMLIVSLLSGVLAIYYFTRLISDYIDKKEMLWVALIFAIFPARWLIVRSVGSSEPLFLATIIASAYYFKKQKYLLASAWGFLAQLTKSPAILLFIAYLFAIFVPKLKISAQTEIKKITERFDIKKYASLFLIPISLLIVFIFYHARMNDFFAYFHSGDNIHLFFPPFQIFNYNQPWVGTFWLEEVILVYLIISLGIIKLIKMKEYEFAWIAGIFFASLLFVSHRDLIRYALPTLPFLYVAFSDTLVKKEFKYIMLILAIPIYLFSITYISQNVMPISDWSPLL